MTEVLINGIWGPPHGGGRLIIRNPATLQPVMAAPVGDARDIAAAETSARDALPSWRARTWDERNALLSGFGHALAERAHEIAELHTLESGQVIRESLEAVHAAARCFIAIPRRDSLAAEACTLRLRAEYPLLHWAAVGAHFLCQGSTLACIAPQATPLAVLRAARCAEALPPGVFNLVVAAAGAAQCAPDEDRIARGEDAIFMDKSLDLDLLHSGAASLRLYHSGQRPGQSPRLYVNHQVCQQVTEELHAHLAFLECGDPRKAATDLGPLRSAAAMKQVEEQVGGALKGGALLKLGGRPYQPWGLRGHFFQPTLMIEGTGKERVPEEEIRGPVVIISPVRDLAEALARQPPGRTARVAYFGRDLQAALESLAAAGIGYELGNPTSPLERIMQSFQTVPGRPLRIEHAPQS